MYRITSGIDGMACGICESHVKNAIREKIIQKLKEQGFRITKQRRLLLDVILKGDCSSCKEIHYKVSKIDDRIGTATVYRMINTLEGIGVISRKNMYKIHSGDSEETASDVKPGCIIELNDDTVVELGAGKWEAVVWTGLKECGYVDDQTIRRVEMKTVNV